MAGSVYVFNLAGEALDLRVNGGAPACGTIGGWSNGPDRYRPNAGAVARSGAMAPGSFANGENRLQLGWPDGQATAQVAVDGGRLPLYQDLLLLVERNQWQLVSPNSGFVAGGEVSWGFQGAAEA